MINSTVKFYINCFIFIISAYYTVGQDISKEDDNINLLAENKITIDGNEYTMKRFTLKGVIVESSSSIFTVYWKDLPIDIRKKFSAVEQKAMYEQRRIDAWNSIQIDLTTTEHRILQDLYGGEVLCWVRNKSGYGYTIIFVKDLNTNFSSTKYKEGQKLPYNFGYNSPVPKIMCWRVGTHNYTNAAGEEEYVPAYTYDINVAREYIFKKYGIK